MRFSAAAVERNRLSKKNPRVYLSFAGTKFHVKTCPALDGNRSTMPLKQAIWEGFSPCHLCRPPGGVYS